MWNSHILMQFHVNHGQARANKSILSSCVLFLVRFFFHSIRCSVCYHRHHRCNRGLPSFTLCVRFTLNKAFRNDNNIIYDLFSCFFVIMACNGNFSTPFPWPYHQLFIFLGTVHSVRFILTAISFGFYAFFFCFLCRALWTKFWSFLGKSSR